MRRILVVFLAVAVLWTLVSQLNHAMSAWHVYIFVAGVFVTFSSLVLPLRDGLIATVLAGCLLDATSPVGMGTNVLLLATAHVVIFNLRNRIPRADTIARVVVALLTNLGIFLVFSFIQIARSPSPAAAWPRLIVDLLASQVFIVAVAPWFFALQNEGLLLVRVPRERLS